MVVKEEKSICDFEQMKREMAVSKIVYACGYIYARWMIPI